MFAAVLSLILFIHNIFGFPYYVHVMDDGQSLPQHNMPRMYFSNFQVDDLNPFNWIGHRQVPMKNETDVKFVTIFEILKCLNTNDEVNCSKLIEKAKIHFQPKTITENHQKINVTELSSTNENVPATAVKPTNLTDAIGNEE